MSRSQSGFWLWKCQILRYCTCCLLVTIWKDRHSLRWLWYDTHSCQRVEQPRGWQVKRSTPPQPLDRRPKGRQIGFHQPNDTRHFPWTWYRLPRCEQARDKCDGSLMLHTRSAIFQGFSRIMSFPRPMIMSLGTTQAWPLVWRLTLVFISSLKSSKVQDLLIGSTKTRSHIQVQPQLDDEMFLERDLRTLSSSTLSAASRRLYFPFLAIEFECGALAVNYCANNSVACPKAIEDLNRMLPKSEYANRIYNSIGMNGKCADIHITWKAVQLYYDYEYRSISEFRKQVRNIPDRGSVLASSRLERFWVSWMITRKPIGRANLRDNVMEKYLMLASSTISGHLVLMACRWQGLGPLFLDWYIGIVLLGYGSNEAANLGQEVLSGFSYKQAISKVCKEFRETI